MVKIISDTPWYIYLFCLLAGLGFAFLLYAKQKDETQPSVKRFLFITRFLFVTLICLLVTNIFLKHFINRTENPVILLAIDNSHSILAGKDSADYQKLLPQKIAEIKQALESKFELNTILFGERVRRSDSIMFNDKQTNIGGLFDAVNTNYAGTNVGALIMLSDGLYNIGADPIYLTDKLNFPLYTVALGDTAVQKDVWISKINHNQMAYLGNQFTAEVVIRATRLMDQKIKVGLYKNKQKKSEQIVAINSVNFNTSLIFTGEADAPGIQKYDVVIEPLNTETNIRNNSSSFVIDVIDNRDKILLLAHAPHPDIASISNAIESMRNYELVKEISPIQTPILKGYNLIIIHGYKPEYKAVLDACLANNIPYWLINPDLNSGLRELKLSNAIDKTNDSEPVLNNSFGIFTISDELKNLILNFPAVKAPFGKYALSNASQVFLQQKIGVVNSGDPLLLFNESGETKSAVFIGDGLWKWRFRNYQEKNNTNAFNELISKTIQFLAVKSDKSFFRLFTNKIIFENEVAEFSAEVYNKSYELINDPEVNLILKNEEGKSFGYTFSKQNNQYKLSLGYLQPGEYAYEAKVKLNNDLYTKKGLIIVKAVMAEKLNNTANHIALQNISNNTGGKLFYLNETELLTQTLLNNESIKPITYSQNETTEIIELKWLFFLIVGFMTVEWFVRKYNGLI